MSESGRKIINIIIAIVVAIGGWIYVVYNNDPMTEVRYKDVPVSFVGEHDLANRGLGIAQTSTEVIDVTLRQKRIDTNQISADDITVIADVSEAAEGENGISLQISGPSGTQVADAERRAISVEVEESDTIEERIYVEYRDDPEGLEPVTSNMTSTKATVMGAKSEVERVDRVTALISYSDTNNRVWNFTTGLSALDEDGDEIEHLVIYPDEINFKAYTGVRKTVKLNVVTSEKKETAEEEESDGYTRTYSAPDTIVIKGAEDVVSEITSVSTELIDIDSMYEDQEVALTYALPEGVHLAYESEGLVMKVKVTKNESETER
jgi:YbbR domain-containing protein